MPALPLHFTSTDETLAFYAGFREELSKEAVNPDVMKNIALLALGAGGALTLRTANEDRRMGRQFRKMQQQQVQ